MNELLNLFNLDADGDLEESLHLVLMFKDEVDEATTAYMEMLQMSIDPSHQTAREMQGLIKEAINAALVTGLRAYRSWIVSEGVDVYAIEAASGKDIPPVTFNRNARWPL